MKNAKLNTFLMKNAILSTFLLKIMFTMINTVVYWACLMCLLLLLYHIQYIDGLFGYTLIGYPNPLDPTVLVHRFRYISII
jgi:hypothetical protein